MVTKEVLDKRRFPSPHPLVEVHLLTYLSDGLAVKGYLATPKKPGVYPGLLYLRGGIKRVGMVRIPRITQFAANGFTVFAPLYRGNMGGEGYEDFCGNDRNDAINGFTLLEKEPTVYGSPHVFGFSRGAVMGLFVAISKQNISSLSLWGGVSDISLTYEERIDLRKMLKRVVGGTPKKVPEYYRWRSPFDQLERINCPTLLIHGKKDTNVSIEHAYRLEKGLKVLGKAVTTWFFDSYTHFFPPLINRKVTSEMMEWMKENER